MIAKRTFQLLLSVFFVLGCAGAAISQQAASAVSTSKLLDLTVPAPSLKGSILGEPTEQHIYVYLPPSYEASPSKRYPSLYLLHGYLGRSDAWVTGAFQGFNLRSTMDELIKAGKVREMIVVAANGWTAYGGSFYTNSPVSGNWEDFITRDLISNIDANYRTIARAESRGIAGHSMGGYGAFMLGMKHPELFSALYALSPCCLVMENDLSEANSAWATVLGLTARDQLKIPPQSFADFFTDVFMAFSAAFSPNPEKPPFYVDFPVTAKQEPCNSSSTSNATSNTSCFQKNDAVYMKWHSHFPVYIAEANKDNLRKLHGIFLDYGEKEQFAHIRSGVQEMSEILSRMNIPHQFEVYPEGDHVSRIRERLETRVFEFFNEKLVFEK